MHSINDLILFILYSINKEGKSSFENLANECFKKFPEVFSLKNFPKLLDSRKLDRPLRYLRKNNFIKGDPITGFSLTKKGRKKAKESAESIRQKKLF